MGFLVSKEERLSIARRVDPASLASKRILITGGSGMVGAYLAESVLNLLRDYGLPLGELAVTSKSGDFHNNQGIADSKNVRLFTSGPGEYLKAEYQYVIHAASPASPIHYESAAELRDVNVGSLKNIISDATERFLFISVGESYGFNAPFKVSEDFVGSIDPSLARSAYPLAKIEAERVARELCTEWEAEMRVARLFHTFGPGVRERDGRSFADFLWQSARGKRPLLKSLGGDIRTFLYSEDTAVGLLTILTRVGELGPVNIGSEIPVSILEFAKLVSAIAGIGGEVEFNYAEADYVHSPNPVFVPSTSALRNLGWRQEVDLQQAIERTLDWIRKEI